MMQIDFDPPKQEWTLEKRGLDFNDFPKLFELPVVEYTDDREDYGEERWVVVGWLNGVLIVAVYTMRGDVFHVISMRKASYHEEKIYAAQVDP